MRQLTRATLTTGVWVLGLLVAVVVVTGVTMVMGVIENATWSPTFVTVCEYAAGTVLAALILFLVVASWLRLHRKLWRNPDA